MAGADDSALRAVSGAIREEADYLSLNADEFSMRLAESLERVCDNIWKRIEGK